MEELGGAAQHVLLMVLQSLALFIIRLVPLDGWVGNRWLKCEAVQVGGPFTWVERCKWCAARDFVGSRTGPDSCL
jgi:hypothetical protein